MQVRPASSCILNFSFTPTQSGTRSGTFTIPTDDPQHATVTVSLTGQGVTSYPVPTITDLGQYSAAVGSPSFSLQVRGTNMFPSTVVLLNGIAQPTTYAAAMLYEPVTAKLYASVGASATTGANTIAVIDPASGNLLNSIPVRNSPKTLAASADGHYLYVGADGDHALQRIDLTTSQVDRTFALPQDGRGSQPTTVQDMRVVPGSPQSVVVSLQATASPSDGGGALFNDSGLVSYFSNAFPRYYTLPFFSFTSGPGMIYFAQYGGSTLGATAVTAAGLTATTSTPSLTSGSPTPALTDGTLLYTASGSIFDPVQL